MDNTRKGFYIQNLVDAWIKQMGDYMLANSVIVTALALTILVVITGGNSQEVVSLTLY